jgi:thioredoxin reductase (NADPH)
MKYHEHSKSNQRKGVFDVSQIFDVAIIGGGPAGLSAAVTARIRNKAVIVFEHGSFSEKLRKAPLVDNYLGIPDVTGHELMENFVEHCKKLNPIIKKEKVTNIYPGDIFTILTQATTYEARSVIIATGVISTALFPGERLLLGKGVSYCATCDGMFFRNKSIAVVSYTREGEKDANFLAEICQNVYYLPQYGGEIGNLHPDITLLREKPVRVEGEDIVQALTLKEGELAVNGVFVLRESDPVENIIAGLEMEGEVIKANRCMATNIPGIFAAGDCTGKPWQISKAVGEGLIAAIHAVQSIDDKSFPCKR